MAFEKIEIPSPRDSFISEIKNRIIKGKMAVGEKLPTERELEAQTGISKSVIHFALKDLEQMGYIKILPRQGAYVADYARNGGFDIINEQLLYNEGMFNYKTTIEIVELRNALEGSALIRLAANHTDEDIAVLRRTVDELRVLADAEKEDVSALAELTKRLHFQIIELCGNRTFVGVLSPLLPLATVIWEYCASYWGSHILLEHGDKLLELIEAGQGIEARSYMEETCMQLMEALKGEKSNNKSLSQN